MIMLVFQLTMVLGHLGNLHPDQDVPTHWDLCILLIHGICCLNQILLGSDAEDNHLSVSVQHFASTVRTLDTVMTQVLSVPRTTVELMSMAIANPILATRRAQEQQNRSIMDSINEICNIIIVQPPPNCSAMRQPTPGPLSVVTQTGLVSFTRPPHLPSPFVVLFGEESNSPHMPALSKKGKCKATDHSQSQAPTPDPCPAQKTFAQAVSTPVAPTTPASWSASGLSVLLAMQMTQQMQLPAVLMQSLISSLLAGNTTPAAPAPG